MSSTRFFSLKIWLQAFCLAALLAGFADPSPAAVPGKIFIETDLEGVSGVYKFAQTRETTTTLALKAREYFMGDLAAVVRGLRAGGATEILVLDNHGNGALVPDLMPPGAKYVTGQPRSWLCGLDDSFAGVVMFGHHAMMGTKDGVLHHTQNSRGENRYWYNGVESGELAQIAIIAGHYGVAPIMVTGDEATCREAHQFFGPDCVTVATKKGIAREAAILYPFSETRRALYEGAKRAMAAIPQCKTYRVEAPIKAKKQYLLLTGPQAPRLITKDGVISDVLRLMDF